MTSCSPSRDTPLAQRGFSLVEMAVVLVILGLLVGGLLMPLGQTVEQARRRDAKTQLQEVLEALYGFALANNRLPCPADPTAAGYVAGQSTPVGPAACSRAHGFVPGRTLGLNGPYNPDGLLTDPWGNPFRYMVTTRTAFTTDITSFALVPDLIVCTGATTSASSCGSNATIADHLVAVVYSQGRDWVTAPSTPDQTENGLESVVVSGSGASYRLGQPDDPVFVYRDYDDTPATRFDDLVRWISPNILYTRLVAANLWQAAH